ncbi:hypothetical protein LGQ02_17665 [Bacillus shivajii]|uniref:hypothetical protein n=1 Tax=Bacillus shivajii TaxID=1983719 RepID=UPI001CFA229B|nr:hypothetical protein [Bacillus shivajii]UCZ52615.1 hypothetical protein LGQ02_17665 [Bacillus shivajii]
MDLFFYITVIVALSLIYYGYKHKAELSLKEKEIELEAKKVDLESKKLDFAKKNQEEHM